MQRKEGEREIERQREAGEKERERERERERKRKKERERRCKDRKRTVETTQVSHHPCFSPTTPSVIPVSPFFLTP